MSAGVVGGPGTRPDERAPSSTVVERLRSVLREQDGALPISDEGFVDLLGSDEPPAFTVAQKLMRTRAYAAVYQLGRPIGRRLAGGFRGPDRDADRSEVAAALALAPGATVLDIGCGPGNFTGSFAERVAPGGLAVGLDASIQMLSRATRDNSGAAAVYVRGDAEALPFDDGVADAVSCLAALYLFNDPRRALSEMLRVLKPGGRLVILTSLGPPLRPLRSVAEKIGGATLFGRHEVTGHLAGLGAVGIEQQLQGVTQTVTAFKAQVEGQA
ncbi:MULTISPECIES: class I SAM-dependent methyltransferase [Tsukamurella]|uniref:class I SAM-dependent methyltransferase n=1 Tax=Tsukamurella TaxID=2060 RepID=UPI002DD41E75|nr:methyltransferase domain-containing protein [Tsukamurella tyrosinosolvens]MEC4614947.1 methyltransferase domain-containing protein [Tsukamurella tyrosinosolvens]